MIKSLVTWLYLRIVYLPEFKKKVENMYPDADISYSHTREGYILTEDVDSKIMRQARFERERIPNDQLH